MDATTTNLILGILGPFLTLIIGLAAKQAGARWGIQVEATHREAMHWALYTGAQLALRKQLTGQAALDLIIGYAQKSVPDALARLKPSTEVLTDLAQVKLEQAMGEKAKDLTGAAVDRLSDALADALRR